MIYVEKYFYFIVCSLTYLRAFLNEAKFVFYERFRRLVQCETGEINIISMVLIIIVVIALVSIFQTEMTDIVTKMFDKIRDAMGV